jgi:hypothetical protein
MPDTSTAPPSTPRSHTQRAAGRATIRCPSSRPLLTRRMTRLLGQPGMSAAAAARGRRSPQVRRSPEKPQKWCWNSSWGSCRSHANASEGRRQLSTPGTGITKTASSAVDIFGAASTEYTLVGDGDGDGWLSSWTARRGSLSGKAHALASVQAAAVTSASLTSLPLYAAGRQAEEATAVEPEVIRSLAVVSSLSLAFCKGSAA